LPLPLLAVGLADIHLSGVCWYAIRARWSGLLL